MDNNIFKIILLQSLPAAGKSTILKYLSAIDRERLLSEYHMGRIIILDDFPYVRMMHLLDNALQRLGQARIFYPENEPLIDGRDWGTLCRLLNEDYNDLVNRKEISPVSAADYLFDRIDNAASEVGIPPRLSALDDPVRNAIARMLEAEAKAILDKKRADCSDGTGENTVIIEYARGGRAGSAMPLCGTCGYQYSLPQFCREILENAALLYIHITPEEAIRRNAKRIDPDSPIPNIGHDIPPAVMVENYGCDDMEYLIASSDTKQEVTVTAYDRTFRIPSYVMDDFLYPSFHLQSPPDKQKQTNEIGAAIRQSINILFNTYQNMNRAAGSSEAKLP